MKIETQRLSLALNNPDDVHRQLEQLTDDERRQVSPVCLARAFAATEPDPWLHGFRIVLREDGSEVGHAGFKGPPNQEGIVELAYGISPSHQGRGYATEAAAALTAFARQATGVQAVQAHTKPDNDASARVLTKCGFRWIGEVIDPEDGLVWRWEADTSQGPLPMISLESRADAN